MSLQEQFVQSRGEPVIVGDTSVLQMDRIPIIRGRVKINFESASEECVSGVSLKSLKGSILLSNGEKVNRVNVWFEKGLPNEIIHQVECPDGELRIWNIYRIKHIDGSVTEDSWTNNAGMVLDCISGNTRKYRCSHGIGEFSNSDLIFEIRTEKDR